MISCIMQCSIARFHFHGRSDPPKYPFTYSWRSGRRLGIICFRDDDYSVEDHITLIDLRRVGGRSKLCIGYSPWAKSIFQELDDGHGRGHGHGHGHGDGYGGRGRGRGDWNGGEEAKASFLLPLTLLTAAIQLGYCIAIWMKDSNAGIEFYGTGLGLVCLLAMAAVCLDIGGGLDAHVFGLAATFGAMIWTGEQCVVRREERMAIFAACMGASFTSALYQHFI